MKVYPLLLGDFDVNEKVLFKNGDFTKKILFPSYAYYIEDGQEKILVDTGFGDAYECTEKLGREVRTPKGMTLLEHLKRLRISPEDITAVVLTHCHWDHIGGLGLFKETKIYCQAVEIPWIVAPPAWMTESYAPVFAHFITEARNRLVLIDGDYALTERVKLKKVGGHSPGSQIVEITGDTRDVIVAGDALFYFDNLEKSIPPGEYFSLGETVETFQYFRNRVIGKPGTIVMPGHDPKLWERYKDGVENF